jgi:hypothetical protein
MPILSNPGFGPRTAIIYITVGSLVDVWTVVWYYAFGRSEGGTLSPNTDFWLLGFFFTGLTLIIVGVLLGHIGRAARRGELPPVEATQAEAQILTTAAAHPNPVVAGNAVTNGPQVPQPISPTPARPGVVQSPATAPSPSLAGNPR